MILYLSIIGVAILLLSGILAPIYDINYFVLVGQISLITIAEILLDIIAATLARWLPRKCADHTKKVFAVSPQEKLVYEKMKIRKWKELIPEIGHFTGFRKNKLVDPKNCAYLERFLLEICYGEIGHFLGLFFGFIILLFFPCFTKKRLFFIIGLVVCAVNIALTLPTIFVLRYNSYKLRILLKNIRKRSGMPNIQPLTI